MHTATIHAPLEREHSQLSFDLLVVKIGRQEADLFADVKHILENACSRQEIFSAAVVIWIIDYRWLGVFRPSNCTSRRLAIVHSSVLLKTAVLCTNY